MQPILTFYKNFRIIAISISLLGCWAILKSHSPYSVVFIFWLKVFTNAALIGYTHFFRSQQFIFFFNLGYSMRKLYLQTLAIDFFIWLVLTIITLNLL